VLAGVVYLGVGAATGHIRRDLLPRAGDFAPGALWREAKAHLSRDFGSTGGGAPYGRLQRWAYASVALVALPLMVLTGFAMSPAISAAYPIFSDVLGGHQSARTLHFFGFAALILFLLVHVVMVVLTGFRRQMRAMTLGSDSGEAR